MRGSLKRIAAAVLAGASAMLLSGCLLTAGKFQSELALMKDGSFSYSYDGEIQMLALSELASLGQHAEEQFVTIGCYDEETFEERDCTPEELAQQKADWDAGAAERAEKAKKDAEMAKALLGGVDPSSPEAGREFADRLERQHGWNKVAYLGNGLFDVEFAISGRMTHDFAFPLIERVALGNFFVTTVVRDGDQVRVDAPGFLVQDQSNPMRAAMLGMAGIAGAGKEESEDIAEVVSPRIVLPQGTFSIVTDGDILANNTDEGPAAHARGKQLVWSVDAQSQQAPMALIGLSR